MPTGPKGQKRPADVVGNAVHVMKVLTGEIVEERHQRPSVAPHETQATITGFEASNPSASRKPRRLSAATLEERFVETVGKLAKAGPQHRPARKPRAAKGQT